MAFDISNQKLRQSIIGLIWPGPISGPLPVNLFRVLAPVLVFYTGPILAAIIMSVLTSGLAIFYFRLLELTGGKEYVASLLKKLPEKAHRGIETKGPFTLYATSILVGVFPYAIFLKLLRYSKSSSEILLVTAAFVSSALWTGIFWGSVVEILRRGLDFAF